MKRATNSPRTLLLSAPGRAGVLVSNDAGRLRGKPMPFSSAHAALSWCERECVTLIYTPAAPEPERN